MMGAMTWSLSSPFKKSLNCASVSMSGKFLHERTAFRATLIRGVTEVLHCFFYLLMMVPVWFTISGSCPRATPEAVSMIFIKI